MFLRFEICRSKSDVNNISLRDEYRNLKKTAAMTLDLASECQNTLEDDVTTQSPNPTPDIFLGDSWFTSLDVVKNISAHYVGNLKTNSQGYPKAYLLETMKDWPSGSYLNLKATIGTRTVFAMGYKYCRSKTVLFLFNEGAGHTECKVEYAYEAKWKDNNLNTHVRKIDRPHIAHLYFSQSNAIDVLNQARQFELRLEKHWITKDGFFRIMTTLFGVTVVDAWNGYKWHLHRNHRHCNIPLLEFVDMLTLDMLSNQFTKAVKDAAPPMSIINTHSFPTHICHPLPTPAINTADTESNASENTQSISILTTDPFIRHDHLTSAFPENHKFERTMQQVVNNVQKDGVITGSTRTQRSRCTVCGRKTAWFCVQCSCQRKRKVWVCDNTTGRDCPKRHCAE